MHSTDNGPEAVRDTASMVSSAGGGVQSSAVSVAANSIPSGASGGGHHAAAGPRECSGCGKRITERFLLRALDLFWHEDCLKCGCCDCRLGEVGSTLYTKANLILCKRDYLRLFGTTGYCAACNKVIPAFEMVMRAKSNVYHLECFACQQCNHRFCVGDRFYLCDNKILCEYDYEERLVFANIANNPTGLAHIRRQVGIIQPAGEHMSPGRGPGVGLPPGLTQVPAATTVVHQPADRLQLLYQDKPANLNNNTVSQQHQPIANQNNVNLAGHNHVTRDDGSSGYGSPDSETFEVPQ
ncbi:insulin gene enhancer protein ISL-2-like isoform X1 [Ctenocephalides felis]|uniref:insulin gene enhancer protein ISL-2-like isoform X1 n=2 Tax=Ctenocephalides felis TaxID=7515 RepID=UPI000E6E20B0|nr:insulin gene enhancer protein ISL-2-like isoform X1 [Ctenocephalides felis]